MSTPSGTPTTIGDETDGLEGLKPPGERIEQNTDPNTILLNKDESDLFMSALEIGARAESKLVCGKRVLMKTADTDSELAIGLLIKPWIGTDAYNRAYKTALVAACVIEIDGQPLGPVAVSDEDLTVVIERKFEYAKKYYPFFLDAVYEKIIEMEQDLKPLLEKLYTLGKGLS